MKQIPVVPSVGILMYVRVYNKPDIAYTVSVLGRSYLNPWWNTGKNQETDEIPYSLNIILTFSSNGDLCIVGYVYSNLAGTLMI